MVSNPIIHRALTVHRNRLASSDEEGELVIDDNKGVNHHEGGRDVSTYILPTRIRAEDVMVEACAKLVSHNSKGENQAEFGGAVKSRDGGGNDATVVEGAVRRDGSGRDSKVGNAATVPHDEGCGSDGIDKAAALRRETVDVTGATRRHSEDRGEN